MLNHHFVSKFLQLMPASLLFNNMKPNTAKLGVDLKASAFIFIKFIKKSHKSINRQKSNPKTDKNRHVSNSKHQTANNNYRIFQFRIIQL